VVTSLELAARTQVPPWTDDLVIRALAAGHGISHSGPALLHVLIENGTLPGMLRASVQAPAAASVVDVTLTPEELLHLAASNGWQLESAAAALTCAAFWTGCQPALEPPPGARGPRMPLVTSAG
jgi:hypothetical protein